MTFKVIFFVALFFPSLILANQVKVVVYAINNNNQEIIQKPSDNRLTLSVVNTTISTINMADGIFTLKLGTSFKPGEKIQVKVDKINWKIIYPVGGIITIPAEGVPDPVVVKLALIIEPKNEKLAPSKLILPSRTPLQLRYRVQVFVTEEENKADAIVESLRSEGFPAYAEKGLFKLDGTGHEDKVFVGEYELKEQAKSVINDLKIRTRIRKALIKERYIE